MFNLKSTLSTNENNVLHCKKFYQKEELWADVIVFIETSQVDEPDHLLDDVLVEVLDDHPAGFSLLVFHAQQ